MTVVTPIVTTAPPNNRMKLPGPGRLIVSGLAFRRWALQLMRGRYADTIDRAGLNVTTPMAYHGDRRDSSRHPYSRPRSGGTSTTNSIANCRSR